MQVTEHVVLTVNKQLLLAAQERNKNNMAVAIAAGADINYQDEEGKTALHYVCQSQEHTEFLLLHFADPCIRDYEDKTAAEYAAEANQKDIAKMLETKANQKTLARQRHAQKKFLNSARFKKPEAQNLQVLFSHNRVTQGATTTINTVNIPRRRIIAADAGAIESAVNNLPLVERSQLVNSQAIATKLKWYRRRDADWNREKINVGSFEINYQQKPVAGHLGNFFMNGIGSYGDQERIRTISYL